MIEREWSQDNLHKQTWFSHGKIGFEQDSDSQERQRRLVTGSLCSGFLDLFERELNINLTRKTTGQYGMVKSLKISGQDFKVESKNLEGLRLDQGAIVGQGKLGSDLIFLLPLAYGQIK